MTKQTQIPAGVAKAQPRAVPLTVRAGWYLGYPLVGEAPLCLVQVVYLPTGHCQIGPVAELTSQEWQRLAAANFLHHYQLVEGVDEKQQKPVAWMLLFGTPTEPNYSTLRHFALKNGGGESGIGV